MSSLPTIDDLKAKRVKICVVGLGYVGLPLAVQIATRFSVVGFDINQKRISELKAFRDHTKEIDAEKLKTCGIEFSGDPRSVESCRVIIVTVPTPVDKTNRPDLGPIHASSRTVGANLGKGSVVVYESTVYPGVTEEEAVPILERESGLKWKQDFWVGYSPERINPGDKVHSVDKIMKIVSGDTEATAALLAAVYGAVIPAGIHVAESIKVAEAAKVIENTQRDINIALMNELALILKRLGVDTEAVLRAAGTKWNFLKFTPGLVGGHCIGVDPYYLTHKAESVGYHPQVILAGRRINDDMGKYVAEETVKQLIRAAKPVKGARVLILGLTFKENIPDLRNSRVIDIIRELKEYEVDVAVHDAHASPEEAQREYAIELLHKIEDQAPYDAVILAVGHNAYRDQFNVEMLEKISRGQPILMDIKWMFPRSATDKHNMVHWQL